MAGVLVTLGVGAIDPVGRWMLPAVSGRMHATALLSSMILVLVQPRYLLLTRLMMRGVSSVMGPYIHVSLLMLMVCVHTFNTIHA